MSIKEPCRSLTMKTNLRTFFSFFCLTLLALFALFIQGDQWIYAKLKPIFPNALSRKCIPAPDSLSTDPKKTETSFKVTFTKFHTKLTLASVLQPKSTQKYSPTERKNNTVHKLKATTESTSKNSSPFTNNHETSSTSGTVAMVTGEDSSKQFFKVSPWKRLVKNVDCQALIRGDKGEQKKTVNILKNDTVTSKQGSDYINLTNSCEDFKTSSGYITLPVNELEEHFPLAFSILIFKEIEQVERLLRAIYRPQNVYCIHIDIKADPGIKNGTRAIAECFDNVYIVPDPSDVQWGTYTVLEPELKCMKLLWTKKKWKYFINLTGQEFPLKTNLELVRILQAYNGANNLEGTRKRANVDRWEKVLPAPHGIIPTKGSVHIAASRSYVDYVLHNPVALDFLEWVKKTGVPDETYFSTLNHNPHLGLPGSYMGEPETSDVYLFLTRHVAWQGGIPCHGKYVRSVCIFGIEDLPGLSSVPHLFANKFYLDYQHYTRDCLEEWHFNKTRDELIHPSSLNITFYKEMPFVKLAARPGNITVP